MFSVLITEPDVQFAAQLLEFLQAKNFFVKICHSLTRTYELLEQRPYDVVITADCFKDGTGIELVEYLHRFSFSTKSILMTKRSSYQERVAAYRTGVDDFLQKPLSLTEFWWRVQNICHRQKILPRNPVALCTDVHVYPGEGILQIRDESITLPKKENQILTCLIHHRARVVGRDELMRWVWQEGELMPKSITLDVYIKRIRMKLGRYSPKLETIRGFGYRIKD